MNPNGPPPIPPPRPTRRIAGKYEVLEIAGRGGMSTVWRAYQHGPGQFRRTVALKQMYPHLATQPLYREMFFEEARVGAALQDPNIAQIHDFLVNNGAYYLVLEWVEGVNLFTYIDHVVNRSGRQTRWELMVAVAIGMLRGLAAAHERTDDSGAAQPIVHRDVTPHNVLIGDKGSARLIDFGLSLARDREGEQTEPGIAKGKPAYLAPEVVRGERATPASDQFAAGSVLWESLTGRRLFGDANQYEALRRIAEGQYEPLPRARAELPDELVETVHRALSLDPEDRFPSVREMARRLGGVLGRATPGEDIYALLARTVKSAREDLGLGHRTQGTRFETPVPQESSGLIHLPGESRDDGDGRKGWLPSWLSRRK